MSVLPLHLVNIVVRDEISKEGIVVRDKLLTARSPPHGRGAGVDNAYVTGTAAVLHTHCHCTGPRMAPDCALPDPAAASCALRHSHPLHCIPLPSFTTCFSVIFRFGLTNKLICPTSSLFINSLAHAKRAIYIREIHYVTK